VFSKTKQVEIYIADGTSKTYNESDTISGGELMPEFELKVEGVFDV
jgi:hypothetical protein